jgi:hypothetical protein
LPAKSAVYQRKLGHDTASLTVADDEIEEELPRLGRRVRK